ncbi:MAG TPA: hypothetical protein VFH98_05970 [Candidatus Limnocylindria bacterium]|jgi:hypothetical protein|nr:hypothetical protein [Candidatus Limnocylindria bacterium]
MQRRRAVMQLRQVLAVIRQELNHDRATPLLAERASEIVEQTALAIEPEPDDALLELIGYIRGEITEIREGRSGNR